MPNFLSAHTMRTLSTFIDVHKRKKVQNMDPNFLEWTHADWYFVYSWCIYCVYIIQAVNVWRTTRTANIKWNTTQMLTLQLLVLPSTPQIDTIHISFNESCAVSSIQTSYPMINRHLLTRVIQRALYLSGPWAMLNDESMQSLFF